MWKNAIDGVTGIAVEYTLADSIAAACTMLLKHPEWVPHVLVVAMDATEATEKDLLLLATSGLESRCAYVCTWGPVCGDVHDAFDHVDVQRGMNPLVMSTWHDRETLRSVLWFACHTAKPAEDWNVETWPRPALVIGGIVSENALALDIKTMHLEVDDSAA